MYVLICISHSLFSGLQGQVRVTKTMCQITMGAEEVPQPQLVLLVRVGVAAVGVAIVPLIVQGFKFLSKDNGGSEETRGGQIDEEGCRTYNEGILLNQLRFPLENLQGVKV